MYDRVRLIEDMHDLDAPHAQHIRDQRPVTAPPDSFRAHQRSPKATGDFEQFVQASGKLRAGDMVGIPAKRRIAPSDVRGIRPRPSTAAERSDPMIGDAM